MTDPWAVVARGERLAPGRRPGSGRAAPRAAARAGRHQREPGRVLHGSDPVAQAPGSRRSQVARRARELVAGAAALLRRPARAAGPGDSPRGGLGAPPPRAVHRPTSWRCCGRTAALRRWRARYR